ncbi:hypothetical protein [uncultured Tateyamaria sp.]|uniref:hypothetical protein n=1 Tax=uncultured Tateyamaria sp. TaxID=455651 RepID=UPI002637B33E|nr:hypothetical protein [uncultured Tateyamaria sp.]
MDQGTRNILTWIEVTIYVFLAAIIAIGFYLAFSDEEFFRNTYVPEDGILETSTAIMLFSAAIILAIRFLRERETHPRCFSVFSVLMIVALIFVSGEEISWGQRIFGIETGEFFLENNRQSETNLHNLEVRGVNLNKLVFGKILGLFLVVFYLILPVLYSRRKRVHRLVSSLYFPVPKIHHGIAMLTFAIVIDQIPSSKRGELNEVCLGAFALLLVTSAQNIKRRRG